jgi:hypothetical protein
MADDRPQSMNFYIYIDPDGSVTITDLVEDLLPVANAVGELPPHLQTRAEEIARRAESGDDACPPGSPPDPQQ